MYYGPVLLPGTDRTESCWSGRARARTSAPANQRTQRASENRSYVVGRRASRSLVCETVVLATVSIKSLISEPFDSATSPGLAPLNLVPDCRSSVLTRTDRGLPPLRPVQKITSRDFFRPTNIFLPARIERDFVSDVFDFGAARLVPPRSLRTRDEFSPRLSSRTRAFHFDVQDPRNDGERIVYFYHIFPTYRRIHVTTTTRLGRY